MQRTRVVLVEMPRLLSDILSEVVGRQADMEVVADLRESNTLRSVMTKTDTDVVVVGRELSGEDIQLLRDCSGVSVLSVTTDGRSAVRYELRPAPIHLDADEAGVSPQTLVDAIRTAAQRRVHPPTATDES